MRVLRLATLAAAGAAALAASGASGAAVGAPSGLHGFLLRADEPATTAFHRTPSFAWNPVSGATSYQFQLSTSSAFRDNGVIYNSISLPTPVAAPPITLPWITGSPHSLYARVRAVTAAGTSEWSKAYGFDVTPPAPPAPLPSYPGLLRWTPAEGATGYDVWLIDVGKHVLVKTNVLDEREFYTFHQSAQWTGTVRWRIRALRADSNAKGLSNGVPISTSGPWSPIYTATNPVPTGGPIRLIATASDVTSDGSSGSPAHHTMPGFIWSGNQSLTGIAAELYRVYVFTDRQCLNPVWWGSVVGGPAFAPRLSGPLVLPTDATGISAARTSYLPDGTEPAGTMFDGTQVKTSEENAAAAPTTSAPGDLPDSGGAPAPSSSGQGSSASSSPAPAGGGSQNITVSGNLGAAVDLWDVDWPSSGYYWTVIPVAPVISGGAGTVVASPGASLGSKIVPVKDASRFKVGDTITIGTAPSSDTTTISAVSTGSITLSSALNFGHAVGDAVAENSGGAMTYQDLELPQDACAAGRVQRFGISSQPSLTTGEAPYVTGLSKTGRLTSAVKTSAYYGRPLVAWTPALGADIYEIQYSKSRYPFKPQIDPRSSKPGYLTFNTSDVLPLDPTRQAGTWWYRVRGFDYNLPSGVQQMGWSDPQKLVVTKPTFTVKVGKAKPKRYRVVPTRPTTRRLVFKLKSVSTDSVVHDHPPSGFNKGDQIVSSDELVNLAAQFGRSVGAVVGSDHLTVTFTDARSAVVEGVATLPGGTLTIRGRLAAGKTAGSVPVVGGTGSFAGAHGTLTQSTGAPAVDTFRLTLTTR